jgi:hypothetical protein
MTCGLGVGTTRIRPYINKSAEKKVITRREEGGAMSKEEKPYEERYDLGRILERFLLRLLLLKMKSSERFFPYIFGLFDKMPRFTLPFAPKGTFTLALMKCPTLPCPFAKMPHKDDLLQVEIISS